MKIKVKAQKFIQPPKIWHKKPGDIVKLLNNDGAPPDQAYYMVLYQKHETTTVYNMHTNMSHNISCSIRCIQFQATLHIGDPL